MTFRYEEVQAWIIPGFYFLCAMLIMVDFWSGWSIFNSVSSLCLGNPSGGAANGTISTPLANGIAVILVFLIPIVSLILGWFLNFCGGILLGSHFPIFRNMPIIKGFYKARMIRKAAGKGGNNKDKNPWKNLPKTTQSGIIRIFELAKYTLDLTKIDRFYYRYVFSRNMFAAQSILVILWVLGNLCKGNCCECRCWGILAILCFVDFIFYKILSRDLSTHARFVFAAYFDPKTHSEK